MEFMLDTAKLQEITQYVHSLEISGVTSNPTIIKAEGKIDFFAHMKKIREIIGANRSLHVQVVAKDYEGILRDAEAILEEIDRDVFVKVPVNEVGLKAMKELKKRGVNVTATAIYTKFQGYLAIAAGADYIAPYFNRMENLNINPRQVIHELSEEITRTHSTTKILAASFKNVEQVNAAIEEGAAAATLPADLFKQAFSMPSIEKAVDDFTKDWESIFGVGSSVSSLREKL
ncbi:fructose-6-phosphate aldolase, TalC/MipB family [Pilibacter termitis]|uniref:Fructose-6-phosphate aldolase, TalC/MipB family n=1 Tax=Pilibacter termitis TaxID=263852 RepID=A0A1T4K0S4_9ENTE|nr:fructose-6-phosphate aldolase [Pilibacter termitis]SJZ35875.1 fructose-6-phosphate aldolase, TalC/MipB family [Pilibacter termitis]